MQKNILLFFLLLFILGCSGVKKTQEMVSDGNYDGAIIKAIDALKTNKTAKGKQGYIYMLEEAFAKAKDRDLRNINLWNTEGNPGDYEKIYTTYVNLSQRQERIRPLLPLTLLKEARNAIFPFDDYTAQALRAKENLTAFLYNNASELLKSNNKMDFRKAYNDLMYLNSITPNYKDVKRKIEQAHYKGTDFVYVFTKNETNMIIPKRLQDDLLDFGTYGLNDIWTVYNNNKQANVVYDYGMVISFRDINISPEQIKEREFVKEKQVPDGKKPVFDDKGNPKKDDKGNPIMEDKTKTVRITIYENKQYKSCQVTAKVEYINLKNNELIDTYPLSSDYVFEYIYSNYSGDKEACEDSYLKYFNRRSTNFPSNEQMVYDTGNDLKNKLKNIIVNNRFR